MSITTFANPGLGRPYAWRIIAQLVTIHLVGAGAIGYYVLRGVSTYTLVWAVVFFFLCHLATTGTHRLYAHQSYVAHMILQVPLLVLAAANLQGPTSWWAGMHIRHHTHTDTARDPYSVRHGFWWAHVGWMLRRPMQPSVDEVRHLLKNKWVVWQQENYWWLSWGAGLLLPTVVAGCWGDWQGGLFLGGFARLVFQYHFTWYINSFAHTLGGYRYAKCGTARTCYWFLAPILGLLTVGEIYHERHHLAEQDYRLGRHWYDIDPGKWAIWLCSKVGLAWNLKRVRETTVQERAALKQRQLVAA